MTRLNPWIFGVVVSLTAAIGYVLCTLFWFAFTESSLDFLNTLFQGMDFHKIYAETGFALPAISACSSSSSSGAT